MEEVFERRYSPSRPVRLGTRRRRAPNARGLSEPGASRSRTSRAHSLDTDNLLATSDRDWLRKQIGNDDSYRRALSLHSELLSTYLKIFQKYAEKLHDDPVLVQWWQNYRAAQCPLSPEETPTEKTKRVKQWLKENRPQGPAAEAVYWAGKFARLQHCAMEWVGYRAECCGARSRSIAVPIGCNDRLCPLCAWHRSKNARIKVKQLYDRLAHPVLMTFTIPNLPIIRKKHIQYFRKLVRQFLKQNEARIDGGIYSIETTFNRDEQHAYLLQREAARLELKPAIFNQWLKNNQPKVWHLHAHVLANFTSPLPQKSDGLVDFYGEKVYWFTRMKWQWEFDWLNLSRDAWAKMPALTRPKRKGKRAWEIAWSDYHAAFEQWVIAKRAHSTERFKFFNPYSRKMELRRDLTPEEYAEYQPLEKWNSKNTRVFHLRPVDDRDGAVKEVLKYLTKGAAFSDMPDQVEEFSQAVKGARMVQTFGRWYGLKLDTAFDPEHLDDWGHKECACGLNCWQRIPGVFFRRDVAMDKSGEWHLKHPHDDNLRGTVPRPTIRALEHLENEEQKSWDRWERRM